MRNFLLSLFVLIFSVYGHAQKNLVYNPSFEEHWTCSPYQYYDSLPCKGWYSIDEGTPDYFNRCNVMKQLDIEDDSNDYVGYCKPRSGEACFGLVIIGTKNGEMEHIQGHLTKVLTANHKYKVSFWVRLNYEFSDVATYNIGAYISKDNKRSSAIPEYGKDYYAISMTPDKKASVGNPTYKFLTDSNWLNISGIYVAKGGEKYITIGMFWDDNPKIVKAWEYIHPKGIKGIGDKRFCKALEKYALVKNKYLEKRFEHSSGKNGAKHLAYYYVDDVSVSEINEDTISSSIKDTTNEAVIGFDNSMSKDKQLSIEANKNIILNNVVFGPDESSILSTSFDELNQLVAYMQKNSATKIVINGYTDNTGTQEKNLSLSNSRAKAVADYLISNGIDKNRVSYKGYGSANPIESNDTEEGRAKNRRVEFNIENITH